MIDPYKMVLVNVVASSVLLLGILFYRNIYPKRKINYFVLLLLISTLPIISIFRKGVYESGDFSLHLYRTISFYNALLEGHFLPSWAAELNAGYGYPLFIFNYPLPYYVISLFHFLGFSYVASMKLFLSSNFILSGLFMYLWTKDIFKNSFAAFTAVIFYQFAPYHLIDLHFKITIGEIVTFTLLPLTFYFVNRSLTKKAANYIFLAGIFFSFLIMSHVVIALFSALLILIYSITLENGKNLTRKFFVSLSSLALGSILSLHVWLTPFFLSQYTILQKIQLTSIDSRPLWQLLFSPWRLGLLFQGPKGEISHLIGYMHLFVVIVLFILLVAKKIPDKSINHIRFWLVSFIVLIFLITPLSNFLWKIIPFIGITGNHRLLILVVFSASVLAGYLCLLYLKKKKLIYLLIGIAVFSTILNWGNRRVIPEINDTVLFAQVWKSTSKGEGHFYANSKWRDIKDPWFSQRPKNYIEIAKGQGEIKNLKRSSINHAYIAYAKTPLSLKENTLYFPGWQVKVNNKIVPIDYQKTGLIKFSIPKGLSFIEVSYKDVPIYRAMKNISVGGFLLVSGYLLRSRFKRTFRR